ncbi:phage baseplate assembly protein V [Streptomyces sparsogenes]|uniref:phage baseplate assembly protein V n=1 Tax=Streptomyces sparsogenes TaxID=67365 RepID=UPI003330B4A3
MDLERTVAGLLEKTERRFYGKYRGLVVDNQDPARLGRLRVSVPSLLGPEVVTGWATPCLPYGGADDQGFLFVPERGAGVWVEFEEGDPEFPIWVGAYWTRPGSQSQLPRPQAADGSDQDEAQDPPTRKIIKTAAGHTVQFEDAQGEESVMVREGSQGHRVTLDKGGITLVDKRGNTLVLNEEGIELTDATGNAIRMNDSAMALSSAVPFSIEAPGRTVTIVAAGIELKKG